MNALTNFCLCGQCAAPSMSLASWRDQGVWIPHIHSEVMKRSLCLWILFWPLVRPPHEGCNDFPCELSSCSSWFPSLSIHQLLSCGSLLPPQLLIVVHGSGEDCPLFIFIYDIKQITNTILPIHLMGKYLCFVHGMLHCQSEVQSTEH